MSNRDPVHHGRYSPPTSYHMSHRRNPTAKGFAPTGAQRNDMVSQVSTPPPSPYLEARIFNLEEEHVSLRGEVGNLKELFRCLSSLVDTLKKGGWPVHVGPFQEQDIKKSHQNAIEFSMELEKLKNEVQKSVNGDADVHKANGMASPKTNGSVPPHLRASSMTSGGTVTKSLPPHLRGKKSELTNSNVNQKHSVNINIHNRLTTDGQVDTADKQAPTSMLSPPASPNTIVQGPPSVKALSLENEEAWMPHHLTTLPAFAGQIPASETLTTFHPDFLSLTFSGEVWSPGLRFVSGPGPCILRNRTYYQIDPDNEPFLPKAPGEHGAKLTAFFNVAPEEKFADLLPEDSNSYEDVPMFVMVGKRYLYFGNYSQTRWSDKLDYDTMTTRIPPHVKNFWADELTAPTRETWVTEALKKHFFPKPEYTGRIHGAPEDATTVDTEKEVELNEKMAKDVRKYVEELRKWEREANMKTAMIKKQFIIDAFEASDADEPPALRLWWEYLECVGWKKDFYDLLCQLQSRQTTYSK